MPEMSALLELTAAQPEIPACEKHGPMTLRTPGTKEQTFCGTWYVCEHAEWGQTCGDAALLPSLELLAQLDEQRANR